MSCSLCVFQFDLLSVVAGAVRSLKETLAVTNYE